MIKQVTFDTYPVKLHVFINESDEDILSYLEKHNIPELVEDIFLDESDEASFIYNDSPNIAIRLRDLSKPEIISHEAFHATVYIMRYIGTRFSKASEEAYAYLLQYIVENIYD